jgi:hypothetical protein
MPVRNLYRVVIIFSRGQVNSCHGIMLNSGRLHVRFAAARRLDIAGN